MHLEGVLAKNPDTSRDMVLGMQCLMRAFTPELAGESLAQVITGWPLHCSSDPCRKALLLSGTSVQVIERVGSSCHTSAHMSLVALLQSLAQVKAFAEVGCS